MVYKGTHFEWHRQFFHGFLLDCRFFHLPLHPHSGCSAVGSALRSGRRGRAFESPHPDQCQSGGESVETLRFFLFCPVAVICLRRLGFLSASRQPAATSIPFSSAFRYSRARNHQCYNRPSSSRNNSIEVAYACPRVCHLLA